jgi:hypothetical protein
MDPRRLVLVAVAALCLTACATSTFRPAFRNPEAGSLAFRAGDTVLAMVVSADEALRRGAEDALARELGKRGVKGVPSCSVVSDEIVQDRHKAKAAIQSSGAAGVVVLRVTARDQEISSTPGAMYLSPYYDSFYVGYYPYGWGMAYDPGYLRSEAVAYVETLVYDLRQDKLLWAGESETLRPPQADAFVRELADDAARQLKQQGLVRRR